MLRSPAFDRCRLLLVTAVVLKGAVWPEMTLLHGAVFVLAGVGAVNRRWARLGFGAVAAVAWMTIASGEYYKNHFYLLAIMTTLAAMVRWDDETAELPWPRLMMIQITAVYFWAGFWKINAAFLSGSVLLFEWEAAVLIRPPMWTWLAMGLALSTIVIEIGLAATLWVPRLALMAASFGLALHLGMVVTVGPNLVAVSDVTVFALLCACTYPLFVARAVQHRVDQAEPSRTFS